MIYCKERITLMNELYLNHDKCKGCYLCVSVCPKEALSISTEVNAKGYNYVMVDKNKCIACGSCYQICPDYVFEIR